MIEIKAPQSYDQHEDRFKIFLSGAIDLGKAVEWQKQVVEALKGLDIVILNPRRDDWDSTWQQVKDDLQFNQQVNWELDAQEAADFIVFVFTKDSKAPISFLEFGMFQKKDCLVLVEDGFYRKGNLEIVCEREDIPLVHDMETLLSELHMELFHCGMVG